MTDRSSIVGVPTALGGHLAGMERTPAELRAARRRGPPRAPGRACVADRSGRRRRPRRSIPAGRPIPIRGPRTAARSVEYLPAHRDHVAAALDARPDPDARLLARSAATARPTPARWPACVGAAPGPRLALAWFDAHGDFNTPDTTPSGNVWGMPFAMVCGRGDAGPRRPPSTGPTVREDDAALLGGQVLDESRVADARGLAGSPTFGAGMLGRPTAGQAALRGWADAVAARVDGFYIAFDLDCLDASGGWALTHARTRTGCRSRRRRRRSGSLWPRPCPVVGFGATTIRPRRAGDDRRADRRARSRSSREAAAGASPAV